MEKNKKGTRKALTVMDVLGALGGANRSFGIIIGFFLIPFKYNLTATQIYFGLMANYVHVKKTKPFHKHNHIKYNFMGSLTNISSINGTFNFFWYLHDKLKTCGFHKCLKAVTPCFNWENFDQITALMKDIKSKDLEMINMIDHDTTKIFEHMIPKIYRRDDTEIIVSDDGSLSDVQHHG